MAVTDRRMEGLRLMAIGMRIVFSFLLQQAMGPNVAGVIGSTVAADLLLALDRLGARVSASA